MNLKCPPIPALPFCLSLLPILNLPSGKYLLFHAMKILNKEAKAGRKGKKEREREMWFGLSGSDIYTCEIRNDREDRIKG